MGAHSIDSLSKYVIPDVFLGTQKAENASAYLKKMFTNLGKIAQVVYCRLQALPKEGWINNDLVEIKVINFIRSENLSKSEISTLKRIVALLNDCNTKNCATVSALFAERVKAPINMGSSLSFSQDLHAAFRQSLIKPISTEYATQIFGRDNANPEVLELIEELCALKPMNKTNRKGIRSEWDEEATRMEKFLTDNFGMKENGKWFVDGVKAFDINKISQMHPDKVLEFGKDKGSTFKMTVREVLKWQKSFVVYAAQEHFPDENGKVDIQRFLAGGSKDGEEAWRMKYVIRISQNPILTEFDGEVIPRELDEEIGDIRLVSVCGADFAGRKHDVSDITKYIINWQDVYKHKNGKLISPGGRDFLPTGIPAQLNEARLLNDLKKMALLRLKAQDAEGVEAVVETGIGLGVFAGDAIGIGAQVRKLSAQALKEVLIENTFKNIKLVTVALPIFGDTNYAIFEKTFNEGYTGKTPVLLIDNDMHKVARTAALKKINGGKIGRRFVTSELNPADSHGVIGEYWQNRGPGTEEKLAMSTLALLTQHHAINDFVNDADHYFFV